MLRELALFAGAGGGILGGLLLGWRTVCAVEIDSYCRGVLLARQRDGILKPFPVWDDICTFDGTPWRGAVDIVTGGFPCQDISCAGKGAGLGGERSGLWREMARVIREVGPAHVLVENSPMLTSRGLGDVLGDLASLGFDARWGVLGADDAGAPHIRKRIWIVANSRERERESYPTPTRQLPKASIQAAQHDARKGRWQGILARFATPTATANQLYPSMQKWPCCRHLQQSATEPTGGGQQDGPGRKDRA